MTARLVVRLIVRDVLAGLPLGGCYPEEYNLPLPTHTLSEFTTQTGPSPSSTSTPARGGDSATSLGAVMEPTSAVSPSGATQAEAHSEQRALSAPLHLPALVAMSTWQSLL